MISCLFWVVLGEVDPLMGYKEEEEKGKSRRKRKKKRRRRKNKMFAWS